MDLKIKKFYVEEASGGSTASVSFLVIDSKFRRETNNFKVNFDASSVNLASGTPVPVLIKYIEKNLKPEELLGIIVTTETSNTNMSSAVAAVQKIVEEGVPDVYIMGCADNTIPFIYYVPSTGALSLIGPYAEEEESVVIDEAVFVNPGVPGENSVL